MFSRVLGGVSHDRCGDNCLMGAMREAQGEGQHDDAKREKIAMTSPVTAEMGDGSYKVLRCRAPLPPLPPPGFCVHARLRHLQNVGAWFVLIGDMAGTISYLLVLRLCN